MKMAASSSSASSSQNKPKVGILSIGDMGMGIARLLRHHDYAVYTVATGRSQHTLDRINRAQIISLATDEELVAEVDILLSIVPPRDAVATARRALEASQSALAMKRRSERVSENNDTSGSTTTEPSAASATRTTTTTDSTSTNNLVYIDLNAISPKTARTIASMFSNSNSTTNTPTAKSPPPPSSPSSSSPFSLARRSFSFHRRESEPQSVESTLPPITISFLDGGIIGSPPSLREDKSWKRPSIVISGPPAAQQLVDPNLARLLNVRIVGDTIGPASALKSCFAALSKGTIALAILSFTTAHTCGVLPALTDHLEEFNPAMLAYARGGLTNMPPKAYRWVEEMRQINETFSVEGGFSEDVLGESGHGGHHHGTEGEGSGGSGQVFDAIAEVYKLVADDTVLGEEKTEKRKRGTTLEDVVECVSEGIVRKKRKGGNNGELEAAWRGSWS
ncbi:uncharacterized protein HMPREF1120_08030 [Exophiala dermatitidis NIH/UT8656]|uniref:Phosphogluconate dehydrogenase NAD-binding putative C-terminal domain-containing protein n=2 Tax=Exophiala dermatitidis TaxID=5970 RepID=H6CA94_EXODN|nr:uncharacterized protein HMPREF1120_08030 [Exophiala dermatitidis NIH/UT8656]EHY60058.1 hypothetical protein HMPREF1120_08030 [Exophiala dermatitidis NIH/UT8656]KAJ4570776.1 hypothetical protein HRR79_003713 [Exophiala dermatitidis]